jgi:hypothetical protein
MDGKVVGQAIAVVVVGILTAFAVTHLGRLIAAHDQTLNGDDMIPADIEEPKEEE